MLYAVINVATAVAGVVALLCCRSNKGTEAIQLAGGKYYTMILCISIYHNECRDVYVIYIYNIITCIYNYIYIYDIIYHSQTDVPYKSSNAETQLFTDWFHLQRTSYHEDAPLC